MGLFHKEAEPDLHAQHWDASVLGDDARNLFHQVADTLRSVASKHREVADGARDKAAEFTALQEAATKAADEAEKHAEAVSNLVS